MRVNPMAGGIIRVIGLLAALAGVAAAQGRGATGAGRWEPDRLRRVIEERYRVVPLQEGVALVPRAERGDVRSIEIAGSTVAINGNVVTGAELRDRLGADADAILALSYLEPAARKALFEERLGKPAEAPPTPPETPREVAPEGERPAAPSETIVPDRRSHADARIHIGGGVHVTAGEVVDGPVVAIGGPATVDGEVTQDVVAVGGSVHLGPTAKVRGDVTSVGGSIDRDEKAEVGGRLNEVSFSFPHWRFRPGFRGPIVGILGGAFGPGVELMATGFRMLLFGLLVVLAFLIARTPIERIERVAAVEPWKAGLVGLLAELLFLPVFIVTVVVLAVSIIGIPLLLFVPPLAIVAFVVALVIGFAGVAFRVGRWAEHTFGWSGLNPLVLVIIGLLAIWALTIVGRAVSLVGWPVWIVSAALLVVGFVVEYVAWTVGLGAAVMTRFGTRPAYVVPPPAPPAAAATPASPPLA